MLIYFVRHGHPDYETDSLTEMGRLQAEAAARRLANAGIQEIYSSPQGRAYETAQYTARPLDLEIQTCSFIHELVWGHRRKAGLQQRAALENGKSDDFRGKKSDRSGLAVRGYLLLYQAGFRHPLCC